MSSYNYKLIHINEVDFEGYLSLIKEGYCIFEVDENITPYLCSEFEYCYQKYRDYDALYEYACLLKNLDDGKEETAWKHFSALHHLAEAKYVKAYYSIGMCYYQGYGVLKDLEKAHYYFDLGMKADYVPAINSIAVLYLRGDYLKKDEQKAFELVKQCADRGYAMAQNNTAIFYHKGTGVDKNIDECIRYYKLAAEQDFSRAHYNLGVLYLRGEDVEENYDDAFYHIYKAALLGYKSAQDLVVQLGNESQLKYNNKYWYQIDEDIC